MPINIKYLKHGDIVKVPLSRTRQFAYGKIIDPKKIKEPLELPLFLRVYRSIHEDAITHLHEVSRELLLALFYLVGQSAAVSKMGWKIMTTEKVTVEEEVIPDTKMAWPPLSLNAEKWGYSKRFSTNIIFADYEKVKHLDDSSGKNIEIVPFLIEMEVLKINGKDIKKELGLQDWLEEVNYKIFSALPVYSSLPKELQGRVAE